MNEKFGRYEIKQHLADGGMASVYIAYDPILRRDVALKTIKPDLLQRNDAYAEMFLEEAAIMGNLEHPHILPVYDYGYARDDRRHPYSVTRLVTNGSLHNYLKQVSMSSLEVIRLVERLASAIDYFHSKKILHRDLKPSNILLADQNHPYITDFGLTFVPEFLREIHTGSPFFMAPEQWKGDVDNYKSDLFSLGLIIFHCFTGRYPVPSGMNIKYNPKIKEYRIDPNNPQIESIRQYLPHLPIGVELVLDRLTRYNPEERYSTASEASEALRQAFQSGQKEIRGKVFISYAHKDRDYVYRLAEQLALIGIDIWIDKNIQPGTNWDSNIEDILCSSDKMLLILSPASVASNNVNDEWSYFLEEDKDIFPFIYEECDIPFRLRRKQYITSSGDILTDVSKIVDILAGGTPSRISIADIASSETNPNTGSDLAKENSVDEDVLELQLSTAAAIGQYADLLKTLSQMQEEGITHTLDINGVSRPIDEVIANMKQLEKDDEQL